MNQDLILGIDQCKENLAFIHELMDKKVGIDAPVVLLEHVNELSQIIGMGAQTLASLEYHLDSRKKLVIMSHREAKLPPSIFKQFLEGETAEINSLYKMAERLTAGLVHEIDAARTIISYQKAEFNRV